MAGLISTFVRKSLAGVRTPNVGFESHKVQKVQNKKRSNRLLKSQIGRMKLALDAATLTYQLHYTFHNGHADHACFYEATHNDYHQLPCATQVLGQTNVYMVQQGFIIETP